MYEPDVDALMRHITTLMTAVENHQDVVTDPGFLALAEEHRKYKAGLELDKLAAAREKLRAQLAEADEEAARLTQITGGSKSRRRRVER